MLVPCSKKEVQAFSNVTYADQDVILGGVSKGAVPPSTSSVPIEHTYQEIDTSNDGNNVNRVENVGLNIYDNAGIDDDLVVEENDMYMSTTDSKGDRTQINVARDSGSSIPSQNKENLQNQSYAPALTEAGMFNKEKQAADNHPSYAEEDIIMEENDVYHTMDK
jgi:hypothetical protein